MKRQKRDRHTLESDRNSDPGEKARERIRRPAYAPERLSFQARRLIWHQGRQMEHMTVDEYIFKKLGECTLKIK